MAPEFRTSRGREPAIPSGMQVLYFGDIASISDPSERFTADEAKRQEILYSWPGVKYAEYSSIGTVE